MGRTDEAGFRDIVKHLSLGQADIKKLIEEKTRAYFDMLPNSIRAFPGVVEFIHRLHPHFRLALTSSASREEVDMVLSAFCITDFFEIVVSGNDVVHSKPHPEPYLLTAQHLQEKPEHCLVIEDSKNGVRSAKAAGMHCIAITTTHNKNDLADADMTIDAFSDLAIDAIKKM